LSGELRTRINSTASATEKQRLMCMLVLLL